MKAVVREELEQWWRTFVATGAVPAALEPVQGRLIRAVHRGCVADEPVFVKTMTFPRAKDRLRYFFRPLPADHEAAMLRMAAADSLLFLFKRPAHSAGPTLDITDAF